MLRQTLASGEDREEQGYFAFIQVISIILALYLLSVSVANYYFSLESHPISKLFVVVMMLFFLSPTLVSLKLTLHAIKEDHVDVQNSLHLQMDPCRKPLLGKGE